MKNEEGNSRVHAATSGANPLRVEAQALGRVPTGTAAGRGSGALHAVKHARGPGSEG